MTQLALNPAVRLDEQVLQVLCGLAGKRHLDPDEYKTLEMLRFHHGPDNPRPLATIAMSLGLSARQVKAIVKTLIEEFDLPIGASRQEPYGYYLCVTADDIEQAARPLENEFLSLAKRIRKLRGKGRLAELLGQLRLEEETNHA